jgi:hypothetical protein
MRQTLIILLTVLSHLIHIFGGMKIVMDKTVVICGTTVGSDLFWLGFGGSGIRIILSVGSY